MREKRAEPRMLCADVVRVSWADERGRRHAATAVLEDICRFGACLQLEQPLPLYAAVQIEHAQGRLEGAVRYCEYREIGYYTGVEFTPDSEWSRLEIEPQHLLDLRELARKASSRR